MRRVGFVRFALVRLSALAIFIALLFIAFQYYIVGVDRDLTSFIPAEFGQPKLIDKQIEITCFSALYSIDTMSREEIVEALTSDRPISRGLLDLKESLKKSRGFSVGDVFERFSNQKLIDDLSIRSSVIVIGASCGNKREKSIKNDIVRDVFDDDIIYHAYTENDRTAIFVDINRKLLLLVSY